MRQRRGAPDDGRIPSAHTPNDRPQNSRGDNGAASRGGNRLRRSSTSTPTDPIGPSETRRRLPGCGRRRGRRTGAAGHTGLGHLGRCSGRRHRPSSAQDAGSGRRARAAESARGSAASPRVFPALSARLTQPATRATADASPDTSGHPRARFPVCRATSARLRPVRPPSGEQARLRLHARRGVGPSRSPSPSPRALSSTEIL